MNTILENEIRGILTACKEVNSEFLESETTEFKKYPRAESIFSSKELPNEISALANYKGGKIIIGVVDGSEIKDGNYRNQLTGTEKTDTSTALERLKGKINPKIDIKVHQIDFEEKNYIIIEVPRSHENLVATNSGKYYIRDGKSSRPIEASEMKSAVEKLSTFDWSAQPCGLLWSNALSKTAVSETKSKYCEKRKIDPQKLSDDAFLEAIEVTKNGDLTNAGLIFLGTPSAISENLGTFEYRFSWRRKNGALLKNEVWQDGLYNTIKRSKEIFKECNSDQEFIFKNKSYSAPILDEIAFNEAYINAIVHRNYAVDGMVSVDYDEKYLTITNPGTFFGGISAKNIVTHQPRHRNKALARIMMEFSLVDRAGMGIKRMGLGSLRYGREFPKFRETEDTVEVKMHARAVLAGIFVLTQTFEDIGLIELYILNSLYRKGYKSVTDLMNLLSGITDNPWEEIKECCKDLKPVELCGKKQGIYVRVVPDWNIFFDVRQSFKIPKTSEKHVTLFSHLMDFQESSNEQITKLLDHKHSSQTSQFLREAEYVYREGKASSARWFLKMDR